MRQDAVSWMCSTRLAAIFFIRFRIRKLSRVLSSLVSGGGGADPLVSLLATGVLLFVAFAASYLPAHRAARLDPIHALHVD